MPNQTKNSQSVVSYDDFGSIMDEGWDELIDTPEFEKEIVYRHYDFDRDNNTGDIDRTTYTEYTILAEVQTFESTDKQVKAGLLQVGDANIFLPARIDRYSNGSAIVQPIRPMMFDEVTWHGDTYKINKITFERIGRVEIFADCIANPVRNVNPKVTYNANYEAPANANVEGRGWR